MVFFPNSLRSCLHLSAANDKWSRKTECPMGNSPELKVSTWSYSLFCHKPSFITSRYRSGLKVPYLENTSITLAYMSSMAPSSPEIGLPNSIEKL